MAASAGRIYALAKKNLLHKKQSKPSKLGNTPNEAHELCHVCGKLESVLVCDVCDVMHLCYTCDVTWHGNPDRSNHKRTPHPAINHSDSSPNTRSKDGAESNNAFCTTDEDFLSSGIYAEISDHGGNENVSKSETSDHGANENVSKSETYTLPPMLPRRPKNLLAPGELELEQSRTECPGHPESNGIYEDPVKCIDEGPTSLARHIAQCIAKEPSTIHDFITEFSAIVDLPEKKERVTGVMSQLDNINQLNKQKLKQFADTNPAYESNTEYKRLLEETNTLTECQTILAKHARELNAGIQTFEKMLENPPENDAPKPTQSVYIDEFDVYVPRESAVSYAKKNGKNKKRGKCEIGEDMAKQL